ncbi:MAG: hypothetical protein MJ072_03030 [Clostridia bacterium]|nr:hypothetical protein [Clostridia bacterium]
MENEKKKSGISINVKMFVSATLVILGLMIVAYILTFIVPGGAYTRYEDENGNLLIDTAVPFNDAVQGGLPFWKWILSPFLVLGASGSGTLLAVIALGSP